jgi:tetratricopeptide (TPR) repeat protein
VTDNKKTCFVVMGFGKKTDFATSRVLDLDKSYHNIIKPAAQEAGCECMRADEIVHAGTIDVPMYDQLLSADVVVADLSTANCNAFYELGVRHALRPFTTITIAEDKMVAPFDVNHILIRRYQHMGEGIDFDEVMRMRGELKNAISIISNKPANDSPVYTFVSDLKPPFREIAKAVAAAAPAAAAALAAAADSAASPTPPDSTQTISMLMDQAQKAIDASDFITAKSLLAVVKGMAPRDPYVTQKLAMSTYKSKLPDPLGALRDAEKILADLNPDESSDTETVGLWGAIHKRLWELNGDPLDLDTAIAAHNKAFVLKKDFWNGINLAFLYVEHASATKDKDEALADRVLARRTWKRVVEICGPLQQGGMSASDHYWLLATMAEAWLGLGELAKSQELLDSANKLSPPPAKWMIDSTLEQRARLQKLL